MSDVKNVQTQKQAQWRPGCFFGGFAGLLLGALVFSLYQFGPALFFGPPKYESVAQVMVEDRVACLPIETNYDPDDIAAAACERARREVEVIKSSTLILRAVKHGELARLPSFRAGAISLMQAITVEQQAELPIIRISVRSIRAEDARAGADAVLRAYVDYVKNQEDSILDEFQFITTEALTDVERELKSLERELEELQPRLAESACNRERLAELNESVIAMETKSNTGTARLNSLEAAIASTNSDAEKQFILQRVLQLPKPPDVEVAIKGLKAEVDVAKAELKTISRLRDEEAKRCGAVAKLEIQIANLTAEIARKTATYEELLEKLKDNSLLQQYSGYSVKVVSRASVPTKVFAF